MRGKRIYSGDIQDEGCVALLEDNRAQDPPPARSKSENEIRYGGYIIDIHDLLLDETD